MSLRLTPSLRLILLRGALTRACCLGIGILLSACAGMPGQTSFSSSVSAEPASKGQFAAASCYAQLDRDRDSGFAPPPCRSKRPAPEVAAAASQPIRAGRVEVNGSLAAGLRLAGNLRTSGNAAMAISLYQSLAEKHPGDAEPLVGLAESFQDSGQYVEARQAALQATALAANDARGYTLAGRASLGLRKPGQALTFFAQALARDPRDPAAWNGKGVAHEIRGEHAKAQQAFLAALEQAPDDIEIRSNQAFSLALSGDYERGIYLLGEIASLPIAPPRVRQNLALALAMKGDSSSSLRIARMDIGNRQAKGNLAFIEHVEKLAEVSTATAAPVQPVVMIEPLF